MLIVIVNETCFVALPLELLELDCMHVRARGCKKREACEKADILIVAVPIKGVLYLHRREIIKASLFKLTNRQEVPKDVVLVNLLAKRTPFRPSENCSSVC